MESSSFLRFDAAPFSMFWPILAVVRLSCRKNALFASTAGLLHSLGGNVKALINRRPTLGRFKR
jgi:hypothetical protein